MAENKSNKDDNNMAIQIYSNRELEPVRDVENVAVEDASGEFEANRSVPISQPEDVDQEDQQDSKSDTEKEDESNKMAMEVHPNPDPEPICAVEEDEVHEEDPSDDEDFESTRSSLTSPRYVLGPEEKQNLEPMVDADLPPDDINSAPTLPTKYDSDEDSGPMEEIIIRESPPPAAIPPPVAMEEGRSSNNASNISKSKSIWSEAPDAKKSSKHKDRCCHCFGCANGAIQVLFSQFFLVVGLGLCSWAMIDCKFINATAGYPEVYVPEPYTTVYYTDPYAPPTASPVTIEASPFEVPIYQRRGFGFVFNETKEGGCFPYPNSRTFDGDEFLNYIEFLGSDWNIPRILGGVALALGWLLFFGSFMMWCISCIKAVRLLVGTILILVIGGFQASTFAVLSSSFCDEEEFTECRPARGFWMMQGGIACYLIAAIFFCTMKDFPGRKALRSSH